MTGSLIERCAIPRIETSKMRQLLDYHNVYGNSKLHLLFSLTSFVFFLLSGMIDSRRCHLTYEEGNHLPNHLGSKAISGYVRVLWKVFSSYENIQ